MHFDSTTGHIMFTRDPLDQWAQSARDPEQPVTKASVERAQLGALHERAKALETLWESGDEEGFDRMFLTLFRLDPRVLTLLTARTAARATVRARTQGH